MFTSLGAAKEKIKSQMISVIEHISKAKIRSYSSTRASHTLYPDTWSFVRDSIYAITNQNRWPYTKGLNLYRVI